MIVQLAPPQPRTRLFRLARETRTTAGIKTELVGLQLYAPDAATAITRAKQLFPWCTGTLVAIPQED